MFLRVVASNSAQRAVSTPLAVAETPSVVIEAQAVGEPQTVGKFGGYLATPSMPRLVIINGAKYARASAETWCDRDKTIKLHITIAGMGVSGTSPIWTINAVANTRYTRTFDNPCAGHPGVRRGAYTIAELYDSAGTLIVCNTSAPTDIDCS